MTVNDCRHPNTQNCSRRFSLPRLVEPIHECGTERGD
jgi:hypothetical protein